LSLQGPLIKTSIIPVTGEGTITVGEVERGSVQEPEKIKSSFRQARRSKMKGKKTSSSARGRQKKSEFQGGKRKPKKEKLGRKGVGMRGFHTFSKVPFTTRGPGTITNERGEQS